MEYLHVKFRWNRATYDDFGRVGVGGRDRGSAKRRICATITPEPFDVARRNFARTWTDPWSSSSSNFVRIGRLLTILEALASEVAIKVIFSTFSMGPNAGALLPFRNGMTDWAETWYVPPSHPALPIWTHR